jgi:hypothetical protein
VVTASSTQQKRRHTPEFSLAVAVCRWPPSKERAAQVEQCFERPIDWPHFLRIVNRHRIAGLANHALAASDYRSVPPEVMLALQNSAGAMTRQGLYAASEVSRLTAVLQDAGIPCVVLKGAPLAVLAYQNLGIRHSKDNDLLVSPRDVFRADAELRSVGYRRTMPALVSEERFLQRYMQYLNEFEYVQERTGQQIDLHYRLHGNSLFGPAMDPHDALNDWQSVDIGGGLRVRTLGEENMLAYLCAHGARHAWFRLKWLADIGAMLARSSDSASRLLETSRRQGTERTVMQALLLCHRFWGTPLPPQMPVADWRVRGLVDSAYSAMTAGDAEAEPTDRLFGLAQIRLSNYLFSRNRRYLWHGFLCELFLPTDMEGLPARLQFLYPVLRLPMWVVRKLKFRKPIRG